MARRGTKQHRWTNQPGRLVSRNRRGRAERLQAQVLNAMASRGSPASSVQGMSARA